MSFGAILYTILIGPLELLYELIYSAAYKIIWNPGLAIVMLSLAVNLLVMPLYKRSDAIQDEEREIQKKLEPGIKHIKASFSGDERMLMLQSFYRHNHYKPTYVLRSATSLLLQIPFFIAAYHFLSGLQLLNGTPFGPIVDLSKPDGLLFGMNALPILMTLVNMVSTIIFTKGYPQKDKIQLYGMALFFLVFLYDSPSGLVFYWTLNNLFSLVKTVFHKMKNPEKVLRILASAAGAAVLIAGIPAYSGHSIMKALMFAVIGLCLQVPLAITLAQKRLGNRFALNLSGNDANTRNFVEGALFLFILVGVVIPSGVISSSPQEFVDVVLRSHPLWHVVSAGCYALGFFVIWMGVFYWLAAPTGRAVFENAIWLLCGIAVMNYMFFGRNLGTLSPVLQYDLGMNYSRGAQLINLLCCLLMAMALAFLVWRWKRGCFQVLRIGIVAFCVMAAINFLGIRSSVANVMETRTQDAQRFQLSKNGENVVVIMLDRALGEYVPYIFQEKPELEKQFAGFTYYDNVISFGGFTNFGSPGLFGGYEYTPAEMNKRDTESLKEKQNEAIRVMPVLFRNNGYEVSVFNPVYANYVWLPDVSVFDAYEDIHAYATNDQFASIEFKEQCINSNRRNFFCYGMTKISPLVIQKLLYDGGNYNSLDVYGEYSTIAKQVITGLYTAKGMEYDFLDEYGVLSSLPFMSNITESDKNTFMVMANRTPHSPQLLQQPNYEASGMVNNTEFAESYRTDYTIDGRRLRLENEDQISHYHVNMAAMIQLGKWFDYLRENGVYDNTRIILAADHGRDIAQLDELVFKVDGQKVDAEFYYPLLMVKDFNAQTFEVSHEYMTNADVPGLAVEGLLENAANPFTGKEINRSAKYDSPNYILVSDQYDVGVNNGNQYLPGDWLSVHDNIWNVDNWAFVAKNTVSPIAN